MTELTDIIDIKNFKRDILNKLAYKGSSNSSKETILLKTFKFYDLNSNGTLNKEEFLKSIARIGVVLTTHQEMEELFYLFADTKKQTVTYKKFIDWVLSETSERAQSSQYEDSLQNKSSILQKSVIYDQRQNTKRVEQKSTSKNPKSEYQNSQKQNSVKSYAIKQSRYVQQPQSQIESQPPFSSPQTFEEVLQWTRWKIREKGSSYFLQLAVDLKNLDERNIHKLPLKQIQQEVQFLKPHLRVLTEEFIVEGDNMVNYAQFLYCIRGSLSPQRIAVLSNVFKQLDSQNKQQIQISNLLSKINKTQYFSSQTLTKAVELYCEFQGINDGVFTLQDFEDFFGFVGIYFKNDQDFRAFVLKTFDEQTKSSRSSFNKQNSRSSRREFDKRDFQKTEQESNKQRDQTKVQGLIQTADFSKKPPLIQKQTVIAEDNNMHMPSKSSRKIVKNQDTQEEVNRNTGKQIDLILIRIKRKLMSKGPRGFLFFQKSLKQIDINQTCYIDIYDFKKIIKEHKINITPTEAQLVFQVFDQGTGAMNYIEFVDVLKGEMSPKRREVIQRVWNNVKVNQNQTTYNQLKRIFNARAHPDIHNGRRFQEDITKQLFQSITCIQDLDGLRSEEISKETLVQYLNTVSASIQDDQLFETILTSVWRLSSSTRIQQFYAGSKLRFDVNKKQSPYLMDHHRAVVSGEAIYQSAPFGTFKNLNEYYRKS